MMDLSSTCQMVEPMARRKRHDQKETVSATLTETVEGMWVGGSVRFLFSQPTNNILVQHVRNAKDVCKTVACCYGLA